MDAKYGYLGAITAVLAFLGLLSRYFMPFYEPYRLLTVAGLFVIGFIVFGYGWGDGWKWPVWLGSVLVMLGFIFLANLSALWFMLAIGLGTISYSWHAHAR